MKVNDVKELTYIIVRKIKQCLKEESSKIAVLIQLAIPIVIVYYNLSYIASLVLYATFLFASWCVKELDRICNHKTKENIPIPPKHFTVKENDYITIDNKDTQEAILYLYTVEEYLKSKGYL